MKCYRCNSSLIWGGDHDYEDYGVEGEGIVTNLSCNECSAYVIVYMPNDYIDRGSSKLGEKLLENM